MQFKQCPVSSQLEKIHTVSSLIISFLSYYFFWQGWVERVRIFLLYLPMICQVVRSNHFLCDSYRETSGLLFHSPTSICNFLTELKVSHAGTWSKNASKSFLMFFKTIILSLIPFNSWTFLL